MAKRKKKLAARRLVTTDEAKAVLSRFGAVRMRDTGESHWGRPDPDRQGGTCNIVISRDRNPLGRGVTKSVIRHAKIDGNEFYRAVADKAFPPPARTTKEGLGLVDRQLARALKVKEPEAREYVAGRKQPVPSANGRLAMLEALRLSATIGSSRWPIWKWLHTKHGNLACAPVELLGVVQDIRAIEDKKGRQQPPDVARAVETAVGGK